jgi:hypothetical protein
MFQRKLLNDEHIAEARWLPSNQFNDFLESFCEHSNFIYTLDFGMNNVLSLSGYNKTGHPDTQLTKIKKKILICKDDDFVFFIKINVIQYRKE